MVPRCCVLNPASLSQGLTTAQYQENLAKFGPNCLTPPPMMPAWLKFLLQFTNFFAMLLLAGGTLCFIGYGIDSSKTRNEDDPAADPTNVRTPSARDRLQRFPIDSYTVLMRLGCPLAAVPRRGALPRGDHHRHLLALPGGQVGADYGGCAPSARFPAG
jgi:hypothetical protein